MTFTYLFFQKIRLLNSQGVFPLKLLKKISGSFYRCLIFKVRRTWVSPQRGSLLYHAVGCLSRGFFNFQKKFHCFGRVLQFAFSVRLRSVQFCEKSHRKTKTSQPALRKQTKNKRNGNPSLFENIKFLQNNYRSLFCLLSQ